MAGRGRVFEEAVFAFFRSLDPTARVHFDHRVLDHDSKTDRQVDVWVECVLWGLCEATVLVSCKDHQRALDIGEIDAFIGEKIGTRATIGLLYSRSGFSQAALQKAKGVGIKCCRLYEGQAPETPSEILLEVYLAYPRFFLSFESIDGDAPPELRWRHILDVEVPAAEGGSTTLRSSFFQWCWQTLQTSLKSPGGGDSGQADVRATLSLPRRTEWPAFRATLVLVWEWYRGTLNAINLHGSTNVTDGRFVGTATTAPAPWSGIPQGDEWVRCSPPGSSTEGFRVTMTQMGCPDPLTLGRALQDAPVFSGRVFEFGSQPAGPISTVLGGNRNAGGADAISVQLKYGATGAP